MLEGDEPEPFSLSSAAYNAAEACLLNFLELNSPVSPVECYNASLSASSYWNVVRQKKSQPTNRIFQQMSSSIADTCNLSSALVARAFIK
jgi:hypothetical protein